MKKYLKFVGILELISFILGVFPLIKTIIALKLGFLGFLIIFVYILLGPAVGLLFIQVSELTNESENLKSNAKSTKKNSNNEIVKSNSQYLKPKAFRFEEVTFENDIIKTPTKALDKKSITKLEKRGFNVYFTIMGVEYSIACTCDIEADEVLKHLVK